MFMHTHHKIASAREALKWYLGILVCAVGMARTKNKKPACAGFSGATLATLSQQRFMSLRDKRCMRYPPYFF
jgi:hypothetical protein